MNRGFKGELWLLLAAGAAVFIWSAIAPFDRLTWWLEVAPVLVVVPLLVATYRRFPLSRLLYRLIFVHAVILMVGGHYTYAHVPLGFWMEQAFGFARNHYDRIGHLAQGFIPAIAAREILLRVTPLRRGKMLFFLSTCVVLAVSAFYELVEWWVAVAIGMSAQEFLGTQGDVWDTQWDMFLALLGALAALTLLRRWHDRSLEGLKYP